ncbi:MAG: Endoribonuclease MazF [Cyanobacteriota bacterium]
MTSLSINPELPKRGEIWLVNFDPTVGAEIKKVRPAVVISSDSVGKLLIKLIAPITDWKNSINRLNKDSAIDTLQLRGVDLQRFIRKLGSISEITMLEIIASIATVIEFEV